MGFRPHIADLPQQRELATTVMGQEIAFPVLISPTGVQAVHPDGEVAVARAAAAAGTAMGLSSFASKPVEAVCAANPKTFFQTYWVGDRETILHRAERARAAGAKALRWLRERWAGPLRDQGQQAPPDDARRAVDVGATAISVSNHRGNNLDGAPDSIRALPGIVDAVGDQVEMLLDGGVRRGSDVVKALALGARAVLSGRAYPRGMAVNGEAGVRT